MTDIPFALKSVNEFIAHRRSGNRLDEDDEILAVCLKGDLDSGLPLTPAGIPATSGTVPAGLGIRESFSLSGIWALCWVDGPLLRSAREAGVRRDAILRMLAESPCPPGASSDPGLAFPVFRADEPAVSVESELRDLKARYPHLMGSSWYRDDKVRGFVIEPA